VTIYQERANLAVVLKAICEVENIKYRGYLDEGANIIGLFDSHSYEAFLEEIGPYVALRYDKQKGALHVLPTRSVRSHIGFSRYFSRYFSASLKEALTAYGAYLGYKMTFHFKRDFNEDPKLILRPQQLFEMCTDLGLSLRVDQELRQIDVSDDVHPR
jgi:hypothetical protein